MAGELNAGKKCIDEVATTRSYALLGWIEPVPHEIPYEGVAPVEVITCTGT